MEAKYMINKVGSEVEFSCSEEQELMKRLAYYNYKKGFIESRLYVENSVIYEYRSPVIRASHYQNIIKYYYIVSKYSNDYYVEGYRDDYAGSFHTHLEIYRDDKKVNTPCNLPCRKIRNIINYLDPFLHRKEINKFRTALDYRAEINKGYLDNIPFDSKEDAITWNTGFNTFELRLNEQIPIWYLLFEEILNGNYPSKKWIEKRYEKETDIYKKLLWKYLLEVLNTNIISDYGLNAFYKFIDEETTEFIEYDKQLFYEFDEDEDYYVNNTEWEVR